MVLAVLGRRSFVLLAGGLLAAACLSTPTLPLPPPAEPEIEEIGQGQYQLTGRIPAPGYVEALNVNTGDIFGQVTNGRYAFFMLAVPGDQIEMWYTTGAERSESVVFEIPRSIGAAAGDAGPGPDGGAGAPTDAGDGG